MLNNIYSVWIEPNITTETYINIRIEKHIYIKSDSLIPSENSLVPIKIR